MFTGIQSPSSYDVIVQLLTLSRRWLQLLLQCVHEKNSSRNNNTHHELSGKSSDSSMFVSGQSHHCGIPLSTFFPQLAFLTACDVKHGNYTKPLTHFLILICTYWLVLGERIAQHRRFRCGKKKKRTLRVSERKSNVVLTQRALLKENRYFFRNNDNDEEIKKSKFLLLGIVFECALERAWDKKVE